MHTQAGTKAHTPSGDGTCVLHRTSPSLQATPPPAMRLQGLGAASDAGKAGELRSPEPRGPAWPSQSSSGGKERDAAGRPTVRKRWDGGLDRERASPRASRRLGDAAARPSKIPPSPPAPGRSPILIFTLWKTRSPSSSTAMLGGIRAPSPAEQPEPERPHSTRAQRPTLRSAGPGRPSRRAPPIGPAQLPIGQNPQRGGEVVAAPTARPQLPIGQVPKRGGPASEEATEGTGRGGVGEGTRNERTWGDAGLPRG